MGFIEMFSNSTAYSLGFF